MPVKSKFTPSFFQYAFLLGCFLMSGCGKSNKAEAVSFLGEIQKLSDPAVMALPPAGKAHLDSSYDRTGGNRDWGDFSNLSSENGYKILKVIQGPGCLHRIWMTGQDPGQWVLFIDGESLPRIQGVQVRDGDAATGSALPFQDPLAGKYSGGWVTYVPVPFSSSLKIGVPKDYSPRSPYFQVNYSLYPEGTPVTPYPLQFSPEEETAVNQLVKTWSNMEEPLLQTAEQCAPSSTQTLASQQTMEWLNTSDSGTLKAFTVKLEWSDEVPENVREDALRDIRLSMYWDGADKPSVNVPLGDFFANAFYQRPYASLPMGLIDQTYICRLPMPFTKGAIGRISNEGPQPVTVTTACLLDETAAMNAPQPRYFHARWSQTRSMNVPAGRPHLLVDAKGSGHLLGCYVNTVSADPSWNILEGDDKYYIDGALSPAMHGTGLEDQFNGAWYYTGLSAKPLSGLLGKAAMNCDQYRWMHGERVPFETRLRQTLEFGHAMATAGQSPNSSKGEITSTSYYYLDHPSGVELPSATERKRLASPMDAPAITAGLIELEHVGLWDVARKRCLALAAENANPGLKQILTLRAANTLEQMGRSEEALNAYAALAKTNLETQTKTALGLMQRYHDEKNSAYIWANSNCKFSAFLNGRPIGSGESHIALYTMLQPLLDGPNELVAEVAPQNDPWVSFVIQSHTQRMSLDPSWEFSLTKPKNWPNTQDDAAVQWQPVKESVYLRPRLSTWNLGLAAFAGAQTDYITMIERHIAGYKKGQPVYFRKRFAHGPPGN